jgi:Spy/CpxP family protein refolding chaperone
MKTKLQSMVWSALLAGGLLVAPGVVQAQQEGGDQKPSREQREARGEQQQQQRREGDNRIEMLRERLALTDAQVEQLKPIFAAERQELMAKRRELGRDADRDAQREAARAIHESYIPKIEAVLTAEQREKWTQLRERRAPRGPGAAGSKPGNVTND